MNTKKMKTPNIIKNNMNVVVFITFILFSTLIPAMCNAGTPTDTIPLRINPSEWVLDTSVNSKGNQTCQYYFIVNGELIPTNKTTIKYFDLAKKHHTKCQLYAIVDRRIKRIKRIIKL